MTLKSRNSTRHNLSGDHLTATVSLRLRTEPEAFTLDAAFEVVYLVAGEQTEEDVAAFAKINPLFHVWPYWREIVQNMCPRMGFPAPTIPLLRV